MSFKLFDKRIESRSNPVFRDLKSLLESSGLKKTGQFLISGRKTVPELMKSPGAIKLDSIIYGDKTDMIETADIQKISLKQELFDELDTFGTHYPLLLGHCPDIADANLDAAPRGHELVLALSNPLNLGAALRSAEAFQVSRVILLKECAHPFLPKTLRASSGSSLKVPLAWGPSIKDLKPAALKHLWALDAGYADIGSKKFGKDFRLLIGEEGQGVPDSISKDQRVSIPMNESMDSLNAVAATSIALYVLFQSNK